MKIKESFNPRINKSNIYKMTPDELDLYNKQLEQELRITRKTDTKKITKLNQTENRINSKNKNQKQIKNIPTTNNSIIIHNTDSEINNTIKSRSNSNNKSNMKNKLIEFQKTKTNKNLIPLNISTNNEDDEVIRQLGKLKLCQHIHLPYEKNYFISEKNLKLIEQAISDKDSDLQNLKNLLKLAKDDIKNSEVKYNELYSYVENIHHEKLEIADCLEKCIEENKQFKDKYDDIFLEYNKILLILKKFANFIDLLQSDNNPQDLLNQNEFRIFRQSHDNILNNFKLDLEEKNKQLKKKIYDYEGLLKEYECINNKQVDLPDVVKDMIDMKKRISELNYLNDNLERENEHLRLSYHNIYNEFNNSRSGSLDTENRFKVELDKLKENERAYKSKIDNMDNLIKVLENSNHGMNSKLINMNIELNNLKIDKERLISEFRLNYDKAISDAEEKIYQLNNNINRLNMDITERDNVISELKMRMLDNQKDNIVNKKKNFGDLSDYLEFGESKINDSYISKKNENIDLFLFYQLYNQAKILEQLYDLH